MLQKDDITSMALFRNKCRKHNLKSTPQRTATYKELTGSKDHPTASTIFDKVRKSFPDISFDTVNRTLLTFSEIGLVSVVEGYGEPKRFDPNLQAHHHFRCVKCNNIIDFHNKSLDNIKIPQEIKTLFTVMNKRVVLEGICDKCREK